MKRHLSADHGGKVQLRHEAKLNIHIGEADIAVKQQDFLAGIGKGLRKTDRENRFADAPLARGDGDDVIARRAHGGMHFGPVAKGAFCLDHGFTLSNSLPTSGRVGSRSRSRARFTGLMV